MPPPPCPRTQHSPAQANATVTSHSVRKRHKGGMDHHRRRVPHVVRGGAVLHAAHRLHGHAADPARQRRVPSHRPDDVPGAGPLPQQGRGLHERRAVLSRDARRDPRRAGVGEHGGLYLPPWRGGRHADRRDGRSGEGGRRSPADARRRRQRAHVRRAAAAAARRRLQGQLLPVDRLVPPAPAQQPDAPRTAGDRRTRRLHRRRRRRGLVAQAGGRPPRRGATR